MKILIPTKLDKAAAGALTAAGYEVVQNDSIAIDELFSNIARYAYAPGAGEATVRVEAAEEAPQTAAAQELGLWNRHRAAAARRRPLHRHHGYLSRRRTKTCATL